MAGLLIGTDGANNATVTGTQTLTNKTLTAPTVGNMANYTFPTGHMRFLAASASISSSTTTSGSLITDLATGTFTAGSRIMLHAFGGLNVNGTAGYGQGYFVGISASTGTASHSGLGTTTSGEHMHQEFGYLQISSTGDGYANTLIVTPTNGATNCTYNYHLHVSSGSRSYQFYRQRLFLWEVY